VCSFSVTFWSGYKFTGKERDTQTGLDNFGARYDASSLGRFRTPDPLIASARVTNPQTWNRYSYTLNNPLKYIDPSGLIEMTTDQCEKDANCVTVKLNVIYDKNANGGRGLTDKQKEKFEKGLLQNAKNEYGDAKIHFDVTRTEASESPRNLQGLQKGSLNVIVTDGSFTTEAGDSIMFGGFAVSAININAASGGTLSHEMAHQFLGDTRGLTNAGLHLLGSHFGDLGGLAAGILGGVADDVADTLNDAARSHLRNFGYSGGEYNPNCTGCYQWVTPFNQGAKDFQDAITPTQK
jgi:RHS repeat-associated protein